MHKSPLTILFLILFIISGFAQTPKVTIKSDGMNPSNYLKMDDFYLTHYLYIDLFLRENLFPDATKEDVSSILKAIKTYVSEGSSLEIEIEKPGKINYKIKMATLKKEDGTELLIAFTNWSTKKQAFEKTMKLENDCYTRWYFLKDSKMTYRKDMSNPEKYAVIDKADLANAYLFDELSDNDTQIKTTLDNYLNTKNLELKDELMAQLIILKYYIFKRNKEKTRAQLANLQQRLANNFDPSLRGVKMAFKATEFQIELIE